MSDRRLRELEQRWRATGDAEDELRYVRARVRAGTLSRPRLLFAAYAGSEAALQLLGDKGWPVEDNLLTWVRGLGKGRLGRHPELSLEASVRAALAAIALVEDRVATSELTAVTQLATAWLGCPCPAHLSEFPREGGLPLTLEVGDILRAKTPRESSSSAAYVVDWAAKTLRGHVLHQRKALRLRLSKALSVWALGSS